MRDKLLKNASSSGVFHLAPARQEAIEKAARHAGFFVARADLGQTSAAPDALRKLGIALHFPDWYGANFDALYDCLTDPDGMPAKGQLLLIDGLAQLQAIAPTDYATLINVFLAAAEARRAMNSAFWVLIDTPTRAIPSFPEA
ncbi:barstar family protein [Dechloromonas sp. HYN0024]|jgi:RNAse (barnase) inhibitor barstar|uniref:barstar family protein n=1 Tax=Dechloromonas sp. HYN0024 TaxID=2231055 RepID=UPI000E430777|nr:barstar family protein [Dechloromonas sp. HYN0024]AXS79048.1 hypothetical protein HYN24_02730 [Dechloromonas sp. HYN0024]